MTEAWEKLKVPIEIAKTLVENKFLKPSKIQEVCLIPAIRDRCDILAAAPTGTGKTLSYSIPMVGRVLLDKKRELKDFENISELKNDNINNAMDIEENLSVIKDDALLSTNPYEEKVRPAYKHIYALVFVPTKDLVDQVHSQIEMIARPHQIRTTKITGGLFQEKLERLLHNYPEIIVCTPGKFWSFVESNNEYIETAKHISVLVLDEADRLFEQNHFEDMDKIIDWLNDENIKRSKPRHNLVFSATLNFVEKQFTLKSKLIKQKTPEDKLNEIRQKLGMSRKAISIDLSGPIYDLVEWKFICQDNDEKYGYLYWFIRNHDGKKLIFTNSIDLTKRIYRILQKLNENVVNLTATHKNQQRAKSLNRFKRESNITMVATDVAARGLDVPNVSYVVHFELAHTAEIHVHRSGRTARAGAFGQNIIMMNPKEVIKFKDWCKGYSKDYDKYYKVDKTLNSDQFGQLTKLMRSLQDIEYSNHQSDRTQTLFDKYREQGYDEEDIKNLADYNKMQMKILSSTDLNNQKKLLSSIKVDLESLNKTIKIKSEMVKINEKHASKECYIIKDPVVLNENNQKRKTNNDDINEEVPKKKQKKNKSETKIKPVLKANKTSNKLIDLPKEKNTETDEVVETVSKSKNKSVLKAKRSSNKLVDLPNLIDTQVKEKSNKKKTGKNKSKVNKIESVDNSTKQTEKKLSNKISSQDKQLMKDLGIEMVTE